MLINSIFLPKTSPEQISTEANPLKFEGFSTLFSDLFKINYEKPETDLPEKPKSNDKEETQNEAISFVNISVFANKNIQGVNKNISDIISEVMIGPRNNLLIPENTNQTKNENTVGKSAKIFAVSKDEFINEIRNVIKNLQLKNDSSAGETVLTIKTDGNVIDINTTLNNLSNINNLLQKSLEGSETFKLLFKSDKKEISVEVTPVTIKTNSQTDVKNLKQALTNSANKVNTALNEVNVQETENDVKNLTESQKETTTETNSAKQLEKNKIKLAQQKPELNIETTKSHGTTEDKKINPSLKQTKSDQSPAKKLTGKSEFLNDLFQKTETKEMKIETNKIIRQNNLRQVVGSQNQIELTERKPDTPKVKVPIIQKDGVELPEQKEMAKLDLKVEVAKKEVQRELFKQPDIEMDSKVKSQINLKNKIENDQPGLTTEKSGASIGKSKPIEKSIELTTSINKSEKTENIEIEKSFEVNKNILSKNNLMSEEKIPTHASNSTKDEASIVSQKKGTLPEQKEIVQDKILGSVKNSSTEIKNQVINENEFSTQKVEPDEPVQRDDKPNLKTMTSQDQTSLDNQKEIQTKENISSKNSQAQSNQDAKNADKNSPFIEVVSEDEIKPVKHFTDDEKVEVPKSVNNEETNKVTKNNQVNLKTDKQIWVKVVVEENSNEHTKVNEDVKQDTKPVKVEVMNNSKNDSTQNQLKNFNDTPKEDQTLIAKSNSDFGKEIKQEFQKHTAENNSQQNVKTETLAGTVQLKQLVVEDKKPISKTPQVIERTKVLSANELLKEVYKVFESGEKQSVVLKLVPKELGAIKITLETIDNSLNAKVEVNNESVGHLMRNNVDSLKQNLLQNGVQVNSINISFTGSEQKQSGFNHQKRRNQNFQFDNDIEIIEETILPKRMGYNTYEFLA